MWFVASEIPFQKRLLDLYFMTFNFNKNATFLPHSNISEAGSHCKTFKAESGFAMSHKYVRKRLRIAQNYISLIGLQEPTITFKMRYNFTRLQVESACNAAQSPPKTLANCTAQSYLECLQNVSTHCNQILCYKNSSMSTIQLCRNVAGVTHRAMVPCASHTVYTPRFDLPRSATPYGWM